MFGDPLAVFFVLAAVVWGAVLVEGRYRAGRSLGSAFLAIVTAMVLSNTGLIPGQSSAYAFLGGPGVSVGIVLILISVDVRSVLDAGPTMLIAFGLGAVGTALGATASAFLLADRIGPETWKLAGQYTGTYTGGGVNFAAVGAALDTSGDLFTAGIAADVIVTAFWMAACLLAPVVLGRSSRGDSAEATGRPAAPTGPTSAEGAGNAGVPTGSAEDPDRGTLGRLLYGSGREIALGDLGLLATIALGVYWAGEALGQLLAPVPSILFLTTLALVLAQMPAVRRIPGAAVMGNYLVLLFLASNGARSVIANIVEVGPPIFYFAVITVAVHGLTIFGAGRLLRIDPGTLAVASQANVGGPASAMAMASARGYADKLLPGVAVGLLGYAVGNYAGLAVAAVLRPVLLG